MALFIGGCSKKPSATFQTLKSQEVVSQLKSFVAEKEKQAKAAPKADGQDMPSEFKSFFAAAAEGDWLAVSNAFKDCRKHAPQYERTVKPDLRFRGTAWQAVIETWGAFDAFFVGDEKYSLAYARDIIDSIPPGSIYFGGTDSGRFLITAMQKSHVQADPFFTLTQNALADATYLDYLRSMYGDKIHIPTAEDSQKCFQNYIEDAQARMQNHQLKPGEDVKMTGGQIQVSGQVAVMEINGLLVKTIFDKNPNHEFYIEESFPLDWMYPHLEPHGLIMKINRQPLASLPEESVQKDREYWIKYLQPMIGDWLNSDTTVDQVAAYAEKAFLRRNSGGDARFVQNDSACQMFSKLRSSIGGLYAWRGKNTTSPGEKERMERAADLAFRQAFALCPYSPEAVFRYVDLLSSQQRNSDALLLAETAARMPQMRGKEGESIRQLVKGLKQHQNR